MKQDFLQVRPIIAHREGATIFHCFLGEHIAANLIQIALSRHSAGVAEPNSWGFLVLWALAHRHWWRCAFHPVLARFHPRTWLGVWGVLLAQLLAFALALPFGSLEILAWLLLSLSWARRAPQLGPLEDPDYFAKRARREGPIFRFRLSFQNALCVADWQLARELLSLPGLASPPLRFDRYLEGGAVRYAVGPPHAACRKSLQRALQPASIERCRPYFQTAVESGIQRLLAAAPLRSTLEELLQQALLGAFFAAAPSDPAYPQLVQLYARIDIGAIERELWPTAARRLRQALQRLAQHLNPQAPLLIDHPEALADPMLRDNLLLLPYTAGQDLAGLLHWIVYHLATHPHASEGVEPESLVWETLRREQSEYLYRRADQPLNWRGRSIARGELIRICVREANRSLGPMTFSPPPKAVACTAFGLGPHRCPGQVLTLTLAALFVANLRQRCQLRLLRDAPAEFDGWHWRPGSGLRVEFSPR